ncbi:MAG: PRC-barrel domain-containing protein [Acidobacteriota bacterium]
MLRSIGSLIGRVVQALDGQLGSVSNFFFHDQRWVIRYVVAETGNWLPGRQVYIAHRKLGMPQGGSPVFPVLSGRKAIEKNAVSLGPGELAALSHRNHLRSSQQVVGLTVLGIGGPLGTVSDLIADDRSWRIRYLVADTGDQRTGKSVLLATDWIRAIDWSKRTVDVDLTPEAVAASPTYRPGQPLSRKDEVQLYTYHRRPTYWSAPS